MFPIKFKRLDFVGEDGFIHKKNNVKLGVFLIMLILIIFIVPYVINFEWNAASESPGANLDEFLKTMDTPATPIDNGGLNLTEMLGNTESRVKAIGELSNDAVAKEDLSVKSQSSLRAVKKQPIVVSTTILGSKVEQSLGKQNPGKACVVFYTDDPEVVESVASTKICPDERDRHIEFHMKGIFSSHPHAGKGDILKVMYIHSGPMVWTTFFSQHEDQHETVIVPPGVTTDLSYLSVGHEAEFYDNFDSVRVLQTNSYAIKTKGVQASFPSCAQFYENKIVGTKTKGFMICGEPKKKISEYPLAKLEKLNISPQTTDTNGISSISAGSKVTVWAYFGKSLDGDELKVFPGSTIDLTIATRKGVDGKESTWNKKVKSVKLKFA